MSEERVRLQKFLSRAGVASRRGGEDLIRAGRVQVNGRTVTELGTTVDPGSDRIAVDGRVVRKPPAVWIALHKPVGYVTTRSDPRGRRTVYDLLAPEHRSLLHVGRLDAGTEGLLLFTNDGDGAHRLLHPSFGVERVYDALVEGVPGRDVRDRLLQGVPLADGVARASAVRLQEPDAREGAGRLRVTLREGRNREVRRMLEAVGYPVTRLRRVAYGPVRLGRLRRGEWRLLTDDERRQIAGRRRSGGS